MLKKERIVLNKGNLRRLTLSQMDSIRSKLKNYVSLHHHHSSLANDLCIVCRIKFLIFTSDMVRRTMNFTKLKLEKSLTKFPLYDEIPRKATKFVHNLSLGFHFKCPPKNVHKIYAQAEFEQISGLTPSSDENRSWFKAKMVDLTHSFLSTPIQQPGILGHEYHQSLKQPWNNPNLLVLKPDKEQGVVIMEKEEYIQKMMSISEDRGKFEPDAAPENVQLIEKQITLI